MTICPACQTFNVLPAAESYIVSDGVVARRKYWTCCACGASLAGAEKYNEPEPPDDEREIITRWLSANGKHYLKSEGE